MQASACTSCEIVPDSSRTQHLRQHPRQWVALAPLRSRNRFPYVDAIEDALHSKLPSGPVLRSHQLLDFHRQGFLHFAQQQNYDSAKMKNWTFSSARRIRYSHGKFQAESVVLITYRKEPTPIKVITLLVLK